MTMSFSPCLNAYNWDLTSFVASIGCQVMFCIWNVSQISPNASLAVRSLHFGVYLLALEVGIRGMSETQRA